MTRREMLSLVFAGTLGLVITPACAEAGDVTAIYVVRHAEKQVGPDAPKDPALTEAGQARADALARLLTDVELAGVYSTDTLRTRTTGKPTADAHGLEVTLYDHADPAALAKTLIGAGGTYLVVGHSNTVNGVIAAFGGTKGASIDDSEYDRLVHLVTGPDGAIHQDQLRYGAPSTK